MAFNETETKTTTKTDNNDKFKEIPKQEIHAENGKDINLMNLVKMFPHLAIDTNVQPEKQKEVILVKNSDPIVAEDLTSDQLKKMLGIGVLGDLKSEKNIFSDNVDISSNGKNNKKPVH